MSLPVVVWQEAEDEMAAGFDYYEQQKPGLGDDFIHEVQLIFQLISISPHLHAIVRKDVRRAVVSRFPYCVYYASEPSEIAVISVFHTSRDPSIWQNRR